MLLNSQLPSPSLANGWWELLSNKSQKNTGATTLALRNPLCIICFRLQFSPFPPVLILPHKWILWRRVKKKKKRHPPGKTYLTWAHMFMNQIRFVCLVGGGTKSFLCHDIKAAKRWKAIFVHHKWDLHIVILQESFIWTGGKTGKQGHPRENKALLAVDD